MQIKLTEDTHRTPNKILIVENDKINRQYMQAILEEEEKYEIDTAANGLDGVRKFEKFKPDIVLLDVRMPIMDGYDACREIKEHEGFVPVIFITAIDRSNDEERERMLNAGADDILTKPVEDYVVKMRVRSYLRLKELHDRNMMIEKKNTALAMAVTANHEMNQPLMIVKGNVELFRLHLEQVCQDPDRKTEHYMRKIEEATQRMVEILDRFKLATSMTFKDYTDFEQMLVFHDDIDE